MLKKTTQYIVPVLLATLVAMPTGYAASLSPDQITEYRQNCTSAQINLKQLQKHDAVARINRGRAYDSMLRQLSAFNSRLNYNKLSIAPQLSQIAGDIQSRIDKFRDAYKTYDEQLANAINADCKQHTSEFYEHIVAARTQRVTVANEVTNIAQLAQEYKDNLVEYRSTLPPDQAAGEAQ